MKKYLAVLLCIAASTTAFAQNSYKVTYDGGSVQNFQTGKTVNLYISASQIKLAVSGEEVATSIPAAAITEISYGQDVHRRVGAAIGLAVVSFGVGALMALTKSKKHFIGLTWDDGGRKGGFAFQVDKEQLSRRAALVVRQLPTVVNEVPLRAIRT
jgi:hypothetical protein